MMNVFKLVFALLLIHSDVFGQDPNFSQFFHNPIYYNPANVALDNGLRVRGNVRNQWGPIPGRFNTGCFSMDAAGINKTGLGIIALSNNEGEGRLRTMQAGLMYSYRPVETKNFRLQAGFGASFVQKRIDWSRFVFSDQLDEVFGNVNATSFIPPGTDRVVYPDFNAGVSARFNSGKVEEKGGKMTTTIGAGFHHLTRPKDAFISDGNRLPFKMVIHGHSNILSYNGVIYSPGFIYERQSNFTTFQVGINMYKNPVYAGFWFRNRNLNMQGKNYDSFVFVLGLNSFMAHQRRAKFCYSYDFTISRLKTSSFGTHEFSVVWELNDIVTFSRIEKNKRKRQKTRFLECVDF
ncbi:MAG: PorP/SprF family type IX secretion system membrane protein [Flavobacteriales bacterium]